MPPDGSAWLRRRSAPARRPPRRCSSRAGRSWPPATTIVPRPSCRSCRGPTRPIRESPVRRHCRRSRCRGRRSVIRPVTNVRWPPSSAWRRTTLRNWNRRCGHRCGTKRPGACASSTASTRPRKPIGVCSPSSPRAAPVSASTRCSNWPSSTPTGSDTSRPPSCSANCKGPAATPVATRRWTDRSNTGSDSASSSSEDARRQRRCWNHGSTTIPIRRSCHRRGCCVPSR